MFFLTTHTGIETVCWVSQKGVQGWEGKFSHSVRSAPSSHRCLFPSLFPSVSDLASLRNVCLIMAHSIVLLVWLRSFGDTCLCTQTDKQTDGQTDMHSDIALLCLSGVACVLAQTGRVCVTVKQSYNLRVFETTVLWLFGRV